MTRYYWYNDKDNRDHLFYCDWCGSFDLDFPRNSKVDCYDYLQFDCLNCGNKPYFNGTMSDIIRMEH